MMSKVGIVASLAFSISIAWSASVAAQRGGAAPAGGNARQGGARQGAPAPDPLGGVAALGQSVKRPPAPTGPVPRLPDGGVDLSGLWVGGGPVGDIEREGGLKPGTLDALMTPEAKKIYASRKEEDNPHYQCLPMGIPRSTPYPFRMIQTPTHKKATHIFILQEGNIHSYRQIFMDGRPHPAELDPTWWGHSIGRWDGDTLVIDTVGFNDKSWFDNKGHPHTEQLHTIERWTRVDEGHMNVEVTMEDPGAYTKPFTVHFQARLTALPGDEIMEYICQENNQYGVAQGIAPAPK
jgi:hypothetical protein